MSQETSEKKTTVEPGAAPGVQATVPQIPDHQLLRRIGAGSYGEVWLARNVMGTYRAVKIVYRRTFTSDRPYEREFTGIQKFEPISRSHEGLVDVLHVGRNDRAGYFFYVMELADDAAVESPTSKVQSPKPGSGRQNEVARPRSSDRPSPLSDFHDSNTPSLHHPSRAEVEMGKTGKREDEAVPSSPLPVHSTSSPVSHASIDWQTYVPRTLSAELHRRGRLPMDECLPLSLALTAALGHLHKHGLIHRDIKPSNIIFVEGVPKLADIGLVADTRDAQTFVGTEGFIPREGPGTGRADIYSLGKVLYEISTGKDRQDYPELPTELPDLASRVELLKFSEVVSKACEEDARKRYQNAEEVHADLRLLQEGKPTQAALAEKPRGWYSDFLLPATTRGLRRLALAASLFSVLSLVFVWQQCRVPEQSGGELSASARATPPVVHPLPTNLSSLPAAEVLKIAYTSAPPPVENAVHPQIQFIVGTIVTNRQGQLTLEPLQDGDRLRSAVDQYLIVARPLSDGYLYIFQVDTSGQKEWLFPENTASRFASGSNPVSAGQTLRVPSEKIGQALYLDQQTGTEHIYAVFSANRWTELEEALAKPSPAVNRANPPLLARRIEEPLGLQMRGVGGARTNAAALDLSQVFQQSQQGRISKINLPGAALEASGSFLALERWFRHVDSISPP